MFEVSGSLRVREGPVFLAIVLLGFAMVVPVLVAGIEPGVVLDLDDLNSITVGLSTAIAGAVLLGIANMFEVIHHE